MYFLAFFACPTCAGPIHLVVSPSVSSQSGEQAPFLVLVRQAHFLILLKVAVGDRSF
jgi:hypothetical protein